MKDKQPALIGPAYRVIHCRVSEFEQALNDLEAEGYWPDSHPDYITEDGLVYVVQVMRRKDITYGFP